MCLSSEWTRENKMHFVVMRHSVDYKRTKRVHALTVHSENRKWIFKTKSRKLKKCLFEPS